MVTVAVPAAVSDDARSFGDRVTPDVDSMSDRAPRLVVVTGAGRSGTSTVAGTLKHLGLAIPQPELGADASNPRGFFEPRWVVSFHKRLLLEAQVATLDARPGPCATWMPWPGDPTFGATCTHGWPRRWSRSSLSRTHERSGSTPFGGRQPAELGVDLCLLTMLRHPAEVVGSRGAYYTEEPN